MPSWNNAYFLLFYILFLLKIQVLIQSNEARSFVCSSHKKFRMKFTMSCSHTPVKFHPYTCYFMWANYMLNMVLIWMLLFSFSFSLSLSLLSKSWKLHYLSHIHFSFESDWLIFSLFRQIISLRVCLSAVVFTSIDFFFLHTPTIPWYISSRYVYCIHLVRYFALNFVPYVFCCWLQKLSMNCLNAVDKVMKK